MRYLYNILAQLAWGILPLIVAYTQSPEIYQTFEKEYSTLVIATTVLNSILINVAIVRLYKYNVITISLSEVLLYAVAVLLVSAYTQMWVVSLVSMLLVAKGLGYGLLEYRVKVKKLFIMESGAALYAACIAYYLLPLSSNVTLVVLLIFSINVIYIPTLLSNLDVKLGLAWHDINKMQIVSAVLEAVAITGLNNIDRAIDTDGEYNFYISSRISAVIFVIVSASLTLTINIKRIKFGINKIKNILMVLILALLSLVALTIVYARDNVYIASGLAALVFTLCYFFIRQTFTDNQRLLVNLIFMLLCFLLYDFVGSNKAGYAFLLGTSMLALLIWRRSYGEYE